jgi:hypothetical protein
MSLLLALSLLIGISSSSAVEVEVAAPPSGDEAAFIRAYDLSGALVAEAAHPASGEDGWSFLQEARDAGKIAVVHRLLGAVPVVYALNGVTMDLQRVGWCLSFDPAPSSADPRPASERRRPNVGLKEVVVRPGDTLVFEMLKMGTFPERREPADAARAAAAAARELEEAEELARDEM